MRIHHLNCISSCPLGGALMDGESWNRLRGRLTCHCLLLELGSELVLVDTGFGLHDVTSPRQRLHWLMLTLFSPELREEMTAIRQVERLGFKPQDVRHIVLTHLDFDHAGGLDDFPWAQVHLLAAERDAAFAQLSLLDRMRYRPQQWADHKHWQTYRTEQGEAWYGFEHVQCCAGLPPDILLVPLIGHTFGHAGVAVKTSEGWLLQAGDAYFYHGEMHADQPYCPAGLRIYQCLMEQQRSQRLLNQVRLRRLAHEQAEHITVFCGHDLGEFEDLAGRNAREPLPPMVHAI